jgi:predicted dehydrogenase
MTPRRFRTIVVGFGKVGAGYAKDPVMARFYPFATHAQVLAAHPDFLWDAVVDPADDALASARTDWKISNAVRTLKDLPRGYDPEVAVIATPPQTRLDVLNKLPTLRAVLVEKPLGSTLEDARAFLAYCQERNILVQVNYWRRADRVFRELAAGRLEDMIGPPISVFGLYGNGLLNNGSHMVDFVRMLFGEIAEVCADGAAATASAAPLPGDVHVPFHLNMKAGLTVSFQPLDFAEYRENGLDIWGEKSRLSILQEGLGIYLYPKNENRAMSGEREVASDRPKALESSVGTALYEMYGNLAAVVRGTTPLWSPGESALETARAVQAVLDSATSGRNAIRLT